MSRKASASVTPRVPGTARASVATRIIIFFMKGSSLAILVGAHLTGQLLDREPVFAARDVDASLAIGQERIAERLAERPALVHVEGPLGVVAHREPVRGAGEVGVAQEQHVVGAGEELGPADDQGGN